MIKLVSCKQVGAVLETVLENERGERASVRLNDAVVGAAVIGLAGPMQFFAERLLDAAERLSAPPPAPEPVVVEGPPEPEPAPRKSARPKAD